MIGWWIACALADVVVDPPPKAGDASVVYVTDDLGSPRRGETVRVVHRPGTSFERERAIGITDGRGTIEWTPEQAGLATLRAGSTTVPLHIAWAEPPAGTLTLLSLLGLTATGVLLSGFRRKVHRPRPTP